MSRTDERVEALHAQLEEKLAAMRTSDEWTTYLAMAARFHTYSANNVFAILCQRPDATRVAGFHAWKAVGRSVNKGAKGIAILAPMRYTLRGNDGEPVTDDDGNARVALRGFRIAHVFDVSDTHGADLVEKPRAELLSGDAPAHLWAAVERQIEAEGFRVERGDCGRANGFTSFASRTVRVRDDVSGAQALKTLIHELGHVLLHSDPLESRTREHQEVEAESTAHVVLAAMGVDSAEYSIPYCTSWSHGKADIVAETAQRVLKVSAQIIAALETADEAAA